MVKTTKPTQARLFDPREKSGYREEFRAIRTQNKGTYDRNYYLKHRDRILEQQKEYQKRNREKVLAQQREYQRKKYIEAKKLEEAVKVESEKQREERLAKQREYYKKRKMKAKQKAYYEANRERILAQQRDYWAKKQEERRLSKTFWGRVRLKLRKLFN